MDNRGKEHQVEFEDLVVICPGVSGELWPLTTDVPRERAREKRRMSRTFPVSRTPQAFKLCVYLGLGLSYT